MNSKTQKKVNKTISETVNMLVPENSCAGCDKSYCCENQNAIDVSYNEFNLLKPFITDAVMERAAGEINKFHISGRYTCPFLENGRCTVYNIRPIICSAHTVTSPIKDCDTSVVARTLIVDKIQLLGMLAKKYRWFNIHMAESMREDSSHMVLHFEKLIKEKDNE